MSAFAKILKTQDEVVAKPISTTFIESQPTVTCSTPYDWSATPLASLEHSHCMNEENRTCSSHHIQI